MTNWYKFVGCDPNICHGKPCFKIKGKLSRIMIYLALEMLEAGESFKDIIKAYPQLTVNHIKAALHYAAETIKNGELISFSKMS